jgi:hypothetical protein
MEIVSSHSINSVFLSRVIANNELAAILNLFDAGGTAYTTGGAVGVHAGAVIPNLLTQCLNRLNDVAMPHIGAHVSIAGWGRTPKLQERIRLC